MEKHVWKLPAVSVVSAVLLVGLSLPNVHGAEGGLSIEDMLKAAQTGEQRQKKDALAKFEQADALFNNGKFEEAKEQFRQVEATRTDLGYAKNRALRQRLAEIDQRIQVAKYDKAVDLYRSGELAKAKQALTEVKSSGVEMPFFKARDLDRYLEAIDEKVRTTQAKNSEADERLAQLRKQLEPLQRRAGRELLSPATESDIESCEKLVKGMEDDRAWLAPERVASLEKEGANLAKVKRQRQTEVDSVAKKYEKAVSIQKDGLTKEAVELLTEIASISAPAVSEWASKARDRKRDILEAELTRQEKEQARLARKLEMENRLKDGKARLQEGKYELAIDAFDVAARGADVLEKQDADDAVRLAREARQQREAAIEAARERAKQIKTRYAQGRELAEGGHHAAAMAEFQKAQKLLEGDPKATRPKGFDRDFAAAKAAFDAEQKEVAAAAARARQRQAMLAKAETALGAGKHAEARQTLADVVSQMREAGDKPAEATRQKLEDLVRRANAASDAARQDSLQAKMKEIERHRLAAEEKATQEDRARKGAEALMAQEEIAKQQRQVEANHHLSVGKGLFEVARYVEAIEELKKAVELDPEQGEALKLLARSQSLLQKGSVSVETFAREVALEEEVRVNEAKLHLANAISEAQKLMAELKFAEAVAKFEEAKSIISYLEKQVDVTEDRRMVESLLAKAKARETDVAAAEVEKQTQQAVAERQDYERRTDERFRQKKSELFTQGWKAIREEEFDTAYEIAEQILELDPEDQSAKILQDKAFQERHTKALRRLNKTVARELDRHTEQTLDRSVPHADLVNYTDKELWDSVISRRTPVSSEPGAGEETASTLEIREKLQKPISLDFVDTPVTDVIAFLHDVSGINMLPDPDAFEDEGPTITLKVENMKLETALDVILRRFAKLDYVIRDEGLFISNEEGLSEYELRTYDVRDLLINIGDPGEVEFNAPSSSGGLSGLGGGDEEGELDITERATDLLTLISTIIKPDSWRYAFVSGGGEDSDSEIELAGESEDAQGGLVFREGDLIVWQTPAVHKELSKLLISLRETKNMQVNIEARFVTLTDEFAEIFGVQWDRFIQNPHATLKEHQRTWGEYYPGTSYDEPRNYSLFSGPRTAPAAYDPDDNPLFSSLTSQAAVAVPFIGTNMVPVATAGSAIDQAGLNLRFSYLGSVFLEGFLRAGQASAQAEVLQCPRLTLTNTQRGNIIVATNRPYVASFTASGDVSVPSISTFDVGVLFDVRAIVSSDRRYVFLELKPTITELVQLHTFRFENIRGVGTAQQIVQNEIQQPEVSTETVAVTVCVPDRGTVMIGGLSKRQKTSDTRGVPVLSKIPILKRLFQSDNLFKTKSNLLIFVKPTIIIQEEEEDKL